MNTILAKFQNIKYTQIWGLFFFYSVFVSLAIQFFILPILLPQYHLGDGLLNGGDWTFYQRKALEISSEINKNGWVFWELRPQGFGLVGIISAIYVFFDIYKPYILIPLFSALHASGALSLVLLIEKLDVKRHIAVLAAVPFLIFPSSLLWVSQILKDIFTINGSLLFLYGIVLLFVSEYKLS